MGKLYPAVILLLLLLPAGCFDPARIIITNGLENKSIEYIYVSSSSEDEWGINSLPEWKKLLPGESLEVTVLPDTYDVQAVDDRGNTYTIWDREIKEDDYLWEVVSADID